MDILKLDVSGSEAMRGYLSTKEPGSMCRMVVEGRYVGMDGGEAEFRVSRVTVKGRGDAGSKMRDSDAKSEESMMGGVEYIMGTKGGGGGY